MGCMEGVGGPQLDLVTMAVEALDRGLVPEQGDDDVAVLRDRLLANDDVVAIENALLDHAVPLHPQQKAVRRGRQEFRGEGRTSWNVLIGQNRRASRHPPDKGQQPPGVRAAGVGRRR